MPDAPRIQWTDEGEERSVLADEVRTLNPRVYRDNEPGGVLLLRGKDGVWIPRAAVVGIESQIQTYRNAGLMRRYIPFSR